MCWIMSKVQHLLHICGLDQMEQGSCVQFGSVLGCMQRDMNGYNGTGYTTVFCHTNSCKDHKCTRCTMITYPWDIDN